MEAQLFYVRIITKLVSLTKVMVVKVQFSLFSLDHKIILTYYGLSHNNRKRESLQCFKDTLHTIRSL